MTLNVRDLSGVQLDEFVAKAERRGLVLERHGIPPCCFVDGVPFQPSTNWSHGGPIIERERIHLICGDSAGEPADWWIAYCVRPDGVETAQESGDTPLEAAMRAYVTSKLGAEIAA